MSKTKIIEFFGLPKTGKTTSVEAVNKYINNDTNLRSKIISERASQCPVKNKLHPLFNYWTVTSLIKEYIEALDQDYDILIADRGINDAKIWINYFNHNSKHSYYWENFLDLIDNKFISDSYLNSLFFTSNIEVILDREYSRQIIKNPGRIVNSQVLDGYEASFKTLSDNQSLFHSNPKIIDTSKLEIDDMIDKVSNIVKSMI